jgi:hypothetical protein
MTSPARRHMLRQSAINAAQQAPACCVTPPAMNCCCKSSMRISKTLKKASVLPEPKRKLKRRMLPEYAPWVAGVLAEGKGAQDAILMTVMIWRIDAGDYAGALEIARYALNYRLAMPFGNRPAGYALAEEIADMSTRAHDAGEPVSSMYS